jgi:PUA domain protein
LHRFSPKEDVSSSTSLKSSVQRHIRTSLLTQLPLLSQPAYRESGSNTTPAITEPSVEGEEDDVKDEEETGGKSKGKKGKGGKSKGGKSKGGKGKGKDEEEEVETEGAEVELTLLDEIWPKKEALGLTKW